MPNLRIQRRRLQRQSLLIHLDRFAQPGRVAVVPFVHRRVCFGQPGIRRSEAWIDRDRIFKHLDCLLSVSSCLSTTEALCLACRSRKPADRR